MADINQGRWTAEIEGDFVVFIIGARLNSKWQPFEALRDLGGRKGMNHMLKYLTEHPEKGLLGYQTTGSPNVQYWRSFEHLEAFAKDRTIRTWRSGATTGSGSARTAEPDLARDLPRPAGEYEAIYGNMPPTRPRQGEPPGAGRRVGRCTPTTEGCDETNLRSRV